MISASSRPKKLTSHHAMLPRLDRGSPGVRERCVRRENAPAKTKVGLRETAGCLVGRVRSLRSRQPRLSLRENPQF